jgi:ABC-2 type transport system permease protein
MDKDKTKRRCAVLGLVFKDFLILKGYVYLSLIFGICFITFFTRANTPLLGLNSLWLIIWFVLARGLFALDDHSRSEAVINSLPFSRTEIVVGRYLASLSLLVYGFLVMLAWLAVAEFAGLHYFVSVPWSSLIAIGLMEYALVTAILFPIFFKVDFMKARWISFLILFIFILPFFSPLQGSYNKGISIPDWIAALHLLSDVWKFGFAIFVFAALTGLTMAISVRLYRTREF